MNRARTETVPRNGHAMEAKLPTGSEPAARDIGSETKLMLV